MITNLQFIDMERFIMEEGTGGGHMDPLRRGNRMYFIHRLGAVLQFGMRMRGTDGRERKHRVKEWNPEKDS